MTRLTVCEICKAESPWSPRKRFCEFHKRQRQANGSTMTEEKVREIRRAASLGEKLQAIADRHEISQPSVSQIVNGRRWANVPMEIADA